MAASDGDRLSSPGIALLSIRLVSTAMTGFREKDHS